MSQSDSQAESDCQSPVIRIHWQHMMRPYGLLTNPTSLQGGGGGRREEVEGGGPGHMDKET